MCKANTVNITLHSQAEPRHATPSYAKWITRKRPHKIIATVLINFKWMNAKENEKNEKNTGDFIAIAKRHSNININININFNIINNNLLLRPGFRPFQQVSFISQMKSNFNLKAMISPPSAHLSRNINWLPLMWIHFMDFKYLTIW